MRTTHHPRLSRTAAAAGVTVLLLACASSASMPVFAQAAVTPSGAPNIQQAASSGKGASTEKVGASLESAAAKAGNTARTVAMSLIGLALAIASIVLAFRRDFKEAGAVFAVGIVAVLLATPAGLSLLQSTVTSLFGA
jgi:hypothetical protein